jgi:hypothetical protein
MFIITNLITLKKHIAVNLITFVATQGIELITQGKDHYRIKKKLTNDML